jgi:hypothetical protein
MISVTESAAQVRANPLFPQGSSSPSLIEASTARALNLKDGQVVQALVQTLGNQSTLLLQGRLIGMPGLPDWVPGQRLRFQAQILPDGTVLLHPLRDQGLNPITAKAIAANAAGLASPAPPTPPATEGSFSRLASLLYRQPGQPDLRQLMAPGGLDALMAKLTKPSDLQIQWQAMRLLPEQLSPEVIRWVVIAIMGSEASIDRARKPHANDPKQLLYQLLAALADNSGEHDTDVQHIKRAIADLDSAQLSALQAQRAGEMAVTVQLPMAQEPPVEIAFERKLVTGEPSAVLSVSVHSNSEDFGELWLKAELREFNQIDLVMWAVRDWVVAHAQSRVAALQQQLQDAGLFMRSFQAHLGARPAPVSTAPMSAAPGVVLDYRV